MIGACNPQAGNSACPARVLALGLVMMAGLALTPARAGLQTFSVDVQGHARSVLVHQPSAHDGRTRLPVVLMLHGGGGTAQAALRETGWAAKAEQEGFLAVFPNALARDPSQRSSFAANPQLWNDGSGRFHPGQNAADDLGFIAALLDQIVARYAVDEDRIFVTGFSNGASMAFRVGAELSQRIAAIAPVAGALWVDPGQMTRPVPMLYITGTADPLNPIAGGPPRLASGGQDRVRAKPKPPLAESISRWAQAMGCTSALETKSDAGGVRKQTCADRGGAEVASITVEGLGHTWAGGSSLLPESMVGASSDKIRATDVIWDFFRRHPRRGSECAPPQCQLPPPTLPGTRQAPSS